MQLIHFLSGKRQETSLPLEILDFGAGRGRTLLEVLKRSSSHVKPNFRWSFWDPSDKNREILAHLTDSLQTHEVQVINDLDALPNGSYDIVVLSNVLHEVTPINAAQILVDVRRLLRNPAGKLVILELSPLIHAEKYAVPYSQNEIATLLYQIGWKVDSGILPLRSGNVQAYWVCGYNPDSSRSEDKATIRGSLENLWDEILKRNCFLYDGKYRINSADDQIKIMDILTTIASILNYRLGNWK